MAGCRGVRVTRGCRFVGHHVDILVRAVAFPKCGAPATPSSSTCRSRPGDPAAAPRHRRRDAGRERRPAAPTRARSRRRPGRSPAAAGASRACGAEPMPAAGHSGNLQSFLEYRDWNSGRVGHPHPLDATEHRRAVQTDFVAQGLVSRRTSQALLLICSSSAACSSSSSDGAIGTGLALARSITGAIARAVHRHRARPARRLHAASPSPSSRTAPCPWSTSPTTPSGSPTFSTSRHQGHLVCARTRRLPARAPRPQSQAGERRQDHARHRRGGVRDGQGIQGLAFRRAWRRSGPLRVPRADVWRQDRTPVRGGQGPLRSQRA